MSKAHEEDELYVILEGKASLRIEDTVHHVEKGTIMYVHAACDHSYFDVEESITAIVFFGAPLRKLKGTSWSRLLRVPPSLSQVSFHQ